MKISALEHQKQIGVLNLDHLKKKSRKPTNENNNMVSVEGLPPAEGQNIVLGQLAHVKPGDLKPVEIGKKGGGAKSSGLILPPPKVSSKLKRDQEEADD
jgi:hypothetical protein